MIKKYVDYLKDNPEGFWFKRKRYGWGWTPATWQGWTVVIGYLVVVLYLFRNIGVASQSPSDALSSVTAPIIVATAILIYISYKKGEKPRWQWGSPKK